jgi:hypothetical protein
MAFRASMYDNLSNHERYWILHHILRAPQGDGNEKPRVHNDYLAGNAHKRFSSFTRNTQMEIAAWFSKNEKMIATFKDMPRHVSEPFPEQF